MRATNLLAISSLVVFAACGDSAAPELCPPLSLDSAGAPTAAQVAGTYATTTFCTIEAGVTTDWQAGGGFIDLVLNADGTTAGRLFVPGGGEDGSDFDEDLTGTWTLSGSTVQFAHAADTFIRDTPFTYATGRFGAEVSFSGTVIRVLLSRQ